MVRKPIFVTASNLFPMEIRTSDFPGNGTSGAFLRAIGPMAKVSTTPKLPNEEVSSSIVSVYPEWYIGTATSELLRVVCIPTLPTPQVSFSEVCTLRPQLTHIELKTANITSHRKLNHSTTECRNIIGRLNTKVYPSYTTRSVKIC